MEHDLHVAIAEKVLRLPKIEGFPQPKDTYPSFALDSLGAVVLYTSFWGGQLWSPTTDLKDAWRVVRQMHDVHGYWMALEYNEPELTWVEFRITNGPYFAASGVTAPLAICRAALAAFGVLNGDARQTYPIPA